MNIVITGAAGFIGSHLSEALLGSGHTVTGLDCLERSSNSSIKQDNLKNALNHPCFKWHNINLLDADLEQYIREADAVFHLAGIAGVRNSWGASFSDYLQANVLLTQMVLEACKKASRLKKLVYASSSSVYGGSAEPYSSEQSPTRPISPYGLTKLAGEQLCSLYYKEYGIPFSAMRYFTVYGPRQRPDMGFHRFMKAGLLDEPVTIFGNGEQTRDFTYVDDVVAANISVLNCSKHDTAFNIGGVETASVNEVLHKIETLCGRKLQLNYINEQPGDPFTTRADLSFAQAVLNYNPVVTLDEGLARQWEYISDLYRMERK